MQILNIIFTIVTIIANGALAYFAITALIELRRLNRKLTDMERHDHCDDQSNGEITNGDSNCKSLKI